MVLGSRGLRAIVVLPLLFWLLALFLAQGIWLGGGNDRCWYWTLFLAATIAAVAQTRVLRRTGEWIEVVSFRGRTRLRAAEYRIHFEVSVAGRFATMQWQLASEKRGASPLDMGLLLLGPQRTIDRAQRVLDLRMTPQTEALFQAARAGGPTPRWQLVVLGVVLLVAASLVVASLDGAKGQLAIHCANDQSLRLSGGYGSVTGSRSVFMRPGDYQVDLWIPERSCWARRRVTIAVGKLTSVSCQDLARANECIAGEAPIISRRLTRSPGSS